MGSWRAYESDQIGIPQRYTGAAVVLCWDPRRRRPRSLRTLAKDGIPGMPLCLFVEDHPPLGDHRPGTAFCPSEFLLLLFLLRNAAEQQLLEVGDVLVGDALHRGDLRRADDTEGAAEIEVSGKLRALRRCSPKHPHSDLSSPSPCFRSSIMNGFGRVVAEDVDEEVSNSVADAAVDLQDFDHDAVHGLEDEPHPHAVSVRPDLQQEVEEGLEALELSEVSVRLGVLLVPRFRGWAGRKGGVFDGLVVGGEEGAVVEEAEVGADEGGEAGRGGAVAEVGEVEGEAAKAGGGRRVLGAEEETVGEEERLEGDGPGMGAGGTVGQGPHERVEERRRGGARPRVDASRALVINRPLVVARGPDHRRIHLPPTTAGAVVVVPDAGHSRHA
ncbi:unnamed protein product [Musa acuminata subsp. burmannicoides]